MSLLDLLVFFLIELYRFSCLFNQKMAVNLMLRPMGTWISEGLSINPRHFYICELDWLDWDEIVTGSLSYDHLMISSSSFPLSISLLSSSVHSQSFQPMKCKWIIHTLALSSLIYSISILTQSEINWICLSKFIRWTVPPAVDFLMLQLTQLTYLKVTFYSAVQLDSNSRQFIIIIIIFYLNKTCFIQPSRLTSTNLIFQFN